MKASYGLIALSVALGVWIPGTVMAASTAEGSLDLNVPVQVSQSLPPIQGGNTGYDNSYNNNYGSNTNPTYGNTYNNNGYQPYNSQPSQYNYNNNNSGAYTQAPLQGYVATAPAGTAVSATLSSPLSSDFARVGDRFTATLGSPVVSGSSVILPAGSQMDGQVVSIKPSGRAGRNGELEIRFTGATLPNGQHIPLSARVQTADGTGIIRGGTTAGRLGRGAVNAGVGAGLGAALGTAMGPLSGGGVGRGAIYGTILGAGMGALGSAAQKGKPAVLDSSQPLNVVLDQPLTVSPSGNASTNYNQPASNSNSNSSFQYYGQPSQQPSNNYYGN